MNKPLTLDEVLHGLNTSAVGESFFELEEDTDLTAEGKPVPSGDAAAVRVLGAKGKRIPMGLAKRLGLTDKPEPAEKAVHKADAEDKAVHRAEEKAHAPHGK